MSRRPVRSLKSVLAAIALAGCTAAGGAESAWTGTLDTLETGVVAVTNPATGTWTEATAWRVVEEMRIGSLKGDGPGLFGSITDLTVDDAGRVYVLEGQAQELRVFDADGAHVRTVGRKGGGPGEFARAVKLGWSRAGTLWITDPQNNRISVFDTAGTYVDSRRTPGGFIIIPWPGRFDDHGFLYSPVPLRGEGEFRLGLVKYDDRMQPLDTIRPPRFPGESVRFELRSGDSFMIAGVPFSPGLEWRLDGSGNVWALLTGEYRLFRLTPTGDTLRTVTRAFEPLPVTAADVERAVENLEWFTRQGGKIDRSKFPDTKPAARDFFLDDEGHLWVIVVTAAEKDAGRLLDVFDPVGRYLGRVRLPFPVGTSPPPIYRDGTMYAVTEDELDVEYVVRARVEKP